MDKLRHIVKHRTIRFGLVGVANTLFNFMVLNFAFYILNTSKIFASIIATICAASISFFLNRNFVFHHKGRSLHAPLMFALVTLTGVLIVQNSVFALAVHLLKDHVGNFVSINSANLVGSAVAMLWNYNGYRMVVFKEKEPDENFVA